MVDEGEYGDSGERGEAEMGTVDVESMCCGWGGRAVRGMKDEDRMLLSILRPWEMRQTIVMKETQGLGAVMCVNRLPLERAEEVNFHAPENSVESVSGRVTLFALEMM